MIFFTLGNNDRVNSISRLCFRSAIKDEAKFLQSKIPDTNNQTRVYVKRVKMF